VTPRAAPQRIAAAAAPTADARAHRAAGFTLLEVLVALVVVVLGMSALLETLTQSARNIAALRERTVAEWIALNQLALTRLNLNAPGIGVTSGVVQNCANGDWSWQQRVSPVAAIPGLLSITVSVRRTGNATAEEQRNTSRSTSTQPGATAELGAHIALGPTAALGSVTDVGSAACASVVSPGSAAGDAGPPGAAGSLGAPDTLGATPHLGPTLADSAKNTAVSGPTDARPRSASGSGSDRTLQWLVTLTGFRGNSLAAASGESPDWAGSQFAGEAGRNGVPNGPGGTLTSPNSSGGPVSRPPLLRSPSP
jgi:type II secretion system protein I